MKIGIIAGNRMLPVELSRGIKQKDRGREIVAICFKGETSSRILDYCDKAYWIYPGQLGRLRSIIKQENLKQCVMAGQISPWRIFYPRYWDAELAELIKNNKDFRPHAIFASIINHIQQDGVEFIDSTLYLNESMATKGLMNSVPLSEKTARDIEYGVQIIERFVELDVGQTIAVKECSVVAAEALEGTDNTIKRAGRIAGKGITAIKFSKSNQDLRFDVPVVGIKTLKVLQRIQASALAIEDDQVIILEKDKFLGLADKWRISIVGIVNG